MQINGTSNKCGGVIIGPDRHHQLLSSSDSQVHLFIGRETVVARTIALRHLPDAGVKYR